jgi:hypothetical protein
LNTVALDIVSNIYINISSKGQQEKKELKCIQSKSMILMMRLNHSYMDRLYAQWGQCGIFMGIRTIQHLFRLFVLSKCKIQSNWILSSDSGKILDLQCYYNRPTKLENFKYVDFWKTCNISSTLPSFYQNNTNNCRNNVQNDRHYFEVYINDNDDVNAYIYMPINKVKGCIHLEMLYRTSGDIYYLHLLLLHKPSRGDKDNITYFTVCGGGEPLVCASCQQLAIAYGIVDSIDDVSLTF